MPEPRQTPAAVAAPGRAELLRGRSTRARLLDWRSWRLPVRPAWAHTLGGLIPLLFAIQVVTGVLLSIYYQASPDAAYVSVRYLVDDVSFGWLIRGIHHWAAELLLILAMAHMIRVFFAGAYRKPRRMNWVVGLLLLFCFFAFRFTGALLPWDQHAYWATVEGARLIGETPLAGEFLAGIARGGPQVAAETMTRFHSAHMVVLPWIAFFLMVLHLALVVRDGLAKRP